MRFTHPAVPKLQSFQYQTPGDEILCPVCGEEISLSGALQTRYEEKLEREFNRKSQVAALLIKQKEMLLAKRAKELERSVEEIVKLKGDGDLSDALKKFCITDVIEPEPEKSKLNHKVISNTGESKGTITWWTKSTKVWTDDWITKVKDDQREVGAKYAVIVSEVLPKGVSSLSYYKDIWVCDKKTAPALANALRFYLAT